MWDGVRNESGEAIHLSFVRGGGGLFLFLFFTHECCRRRLSLIKTVNEVEELLIDLVDAFE